MKSAAEYSVQEVVINDVFHCVRCGKDHKQLEFKKLQNHGSLFTHFAMCPNCAQPILLRFRDVED